MPPLNLTVQTRVAATTSNLGPGFDTLGIALRLYNHTRLTPNGTRRFRMVSPLEPAAAKGANARGAEDGPWVGLRVQWSASRAANRRS